MNLLKSPLRRTTAVLAGAVLGMAGAVAFAAPASAHHTTVNPKSSCVLDEEAGTWKVTWEILNSEHDLEAEAKVGAQPQDKSKLLGDVATTGIVKLEAGGSAIVETEVTGSDWAALAVHAKWVRNGQKVTSDDRGSIKKPTELCDEPEPEPTPTTPAPTTPAPTTPAPEPSPGEPMPILEADCDTLTIGLNNPEDGEDITLTFKTSKGETRELEVKAGEEKTTKFSASEGFSVEIGVKGEEGTETVTWEQPEGCEGQGGGEPELPVTGAAVGGIAGGAGVLLALGAGLFVMARRRKVKFTA